jgi:hypothetical protein
MRQPILVQLTRLVIDKPILIASAKGCYWAKPAQPNVLGPLRI